MPSVDLSPDTLARLEAQLQADLDAVRRVRALLAAPKRAAHPSPAPQPAQSAASAAAEERIPPLPEGMPSVPPAPVPASVIQLPLATSVAVARAAALMDGEFGMKALKATLAREQLGGHAETDIRKILNRLVKTGELRVVNVGLGRRGNTYERIVKS